MDIEFDADNDAPKHPEKPDRISRQEWDAADISELTDEQFDRARPFEELFLAQAAQLKNQGGRPRLEHPKVKVAWRLSADVVEHVKKIGKGQTARVEAVLKDAIARGML